MLLLSVCVSIPAIPEFHTLVGKEAAEERQSSIGEDLRISLALKKCFACMMNCEKKVFVDQLDMLVKRVTEDGESIIQQVFYFCDTFTLPHIARPQLAWSQICLCCIAAKYVMFGMTTTIAEKHKQI